MRSWWGGSETTRLSQSDALSRCFEPPSPLWFEPSATSRWQPLWDCWWVLEHLFLFSCPSPLTHLDEATKNILNRILVLSGFVIGNYSVFLAYCDSLLRILHHQRDMIAFDEPTNEVFSSVLASYLILLLGFPVFFLAYFDNLLRFLYHQRDMIAFDEQTNEAFSPVLASYLGLLLVFPVFSLASSDSLLICITNAIW